MSSFTLTGKAVSCFDEVDEVTKAFMDKHDVSGAAIAIVLERRLVFARGYTRDDGVAPRVLPTSTFRLASISKVITRVAVNLCFGGDLTHKVAPFLGLTVPPGATVDSHWEDVTLQHLYDHTSGIGSSGGDAAAALAYGTPLPATKYQVAGLQVSEPFGFAPGTKSEYSNYGYAMLGMAIEKHSGASYERYVQEHVLGPLGIIRAFIGGSHRSERAPGEVCYVDRDSRWGDSAFHDDKRLVNFCYGYMNMPNQDAFGGWVMSAPDYARFLAAHGPTKNLRFPDNGWYAGTRTYFTYDEARDRGVVMLFNNDLANDTGGTDNAFPTLISSVLAKVPTKHWPAGDAFAAVAIPAPTVHWADTDLTDLDEAPTGPQPKAYVRGDGAFSVLYCSSAITELVKAGQNWEAFDFSAETGAPDGGTPEGYLRHDGVSAVVYVNPAKHVIEVSLSGGAWHAADLTSMIGAPLAHGDAPMGFVREDEFEVVPAVPKHPHGRISTVVYRGKDNHLHALELRGSSWSHTDLTEASAGAPVHGPPFAMVRADGVSSVFYAGADHHVHEVSFDSKAWRHGDLTALTGGTGTTTNRLMGYVRPDGGTSVLFSGAGGHLQEIVLADGWWVQYDLTATSGSPPMLSFSEVGEGPVPWGYVRSDRTAAVLYACEENHLHELTLSDGRWEHEDLTALTGGAPTLTARGYVRPDGVTAVLYSAASDAHIHQIAPARTLPGITNRNIGRNIGKPPP